MSSLSWGVNEALGAPSSRATAEVSRESGRTPLRIKGVNMSETEQQSDSETADTLFDDYNEFAKVLRTWFVAWGIGGPVLFATNLTVRAKLTASGHARFITLLFLAGVGLQVILAILNKTALWLCYAAKREERAPTRWAHWWAYDFCSEFAIDACSFGTFALATIWAALIVT